MTTPPCYSTFKSGGPIRLAAKADVAEAANLVIQLFGDRCVTALANQYIDIEKKRIITGTYLTFLKVQEEKKKGTASEVIRQAEEIQEWVILFPSSLKPQHLYEWAVKKSYALLQWPQQETCEEEEEISSARHFIKLQLKGTKALYAYFDEDKTPKDTFPLQRAFSFHPALIENEQELSWSHILNDWVFLWKGVAGQNSRYKKREAFLKLFNNARFNSWESHSNKYLKLNIQECGVHAYVVERTLSAAESTCKCPLPPTFRQAEWQRIGDDETARLNLTYFLGVQKRLENYQGLDPVLLGYKLFFRLVKFFKFDDKDQESRSCLLGWIMERERNAAHLYEDFLPDVNFTFPDPRVISTVLLKMKHLTPRDPENLYYVFCVMLYTPQVDTSSISKNLRCHEITAVALQIEAGRRLTDFANFRNNQQAILQSFGLDLGVIFLLRRTVKKCGKFKEDTLMSFLLTRPTISMKRFYQTVLPCLNKSENKDEEIQNREEALGNLLHLLTTNTRHAAQINFYKDRIYARLRQELHLEQTGKKLLEIANFGADQQRILQGHGLDLGVMLLLYRRTEKCGKFNTDTVMSFLLTRPSIPSERFYKEITPLLNTSENTNEKMKVREEALDNLLTQLVTSNENATQVNFYRDHIFTPLKHMLDDGEVIQLEEAED